MCTPSDERPGEVPVRILDGAAFNHFEGFCVEFSRSVLGGAHDWHGSLDAFNDILRGGFGTPDGPWVLRWRGAGHSRQALGWSATRRWLAESMRRCHPSNRPDVVERLREADQQRGETLFDMIVTIIRDHGEGGSESEDGVVLELEE
jgi:hypothetical protein